MAANTAELVAKLREVYTCVDGPPVAFFEIPCDTITKERPEVVVARVTYGLIQRAMVGGADLNEHVLCSWAWSRLNALLTHELREDRAVLLFWRIHPTLTEFVDREGRVCTSLRMRLAIPGYELGDLVTPDGSAPVWL